MQKLARAVFGTNNDVGAVPVLCLHPLRDGLAACFGSSAFNSFDQIEDANVLFIIGSNTTEAHPVSQPEDK